MSIHLKMFNATSFQDLEAQFQAWSDVTGEPYIVKSELVVTPLVREAGRVSLNFTLAVFFKPARTVAESRFEETGRAGAAF